MIDGNGGWSLGFTHDQWTLTRGQAFPLTLTFDGQQPFNVHGVPIADKLVRVPMPSNSALIAQFRKAKAMTAYTQGQLFQFNLDQTGQLLPVLANCVAKTKQTGVASAGDFSLPVAKTGGSRGAIGFCSGQDRQTVQPDRHRFSGEHEWTPRDQCACCPAMRRRHLGQSVRRGARQTAPGLERRDQRSRIASGVGLVQGRCQDSWDRAIQSGDSVVAIGYPFHGLLTSDFTVTTGIVSSLSGVLNDTRFLQISAAVQPGNSGGPLLASNGDVVGVVAAKLNTFKFARATGNIPENINFAIKTGALRDFLDNSVVPYQISDAKAELKTVDIARNARAFTFLVSCKASRRRPQKNKPDLGIFPTRRSGRLTPKAFRAYRELLLRECAAWAFQLLQLTLARLRWSVASGRRVCRSYAAMMC